MTRTAALVASLAIALVAAAAPAAISFDPATNYAAATQPDGVAIAQFAGNNRPDLAVTADAPDRVEIRLNDGNGGFGAPTAVLTGAGTSPHSLAALNFDNDGDADLVVTLQGTDQVRFLVNNAGVLSLGAATGVGGSEPRYLAVGDLDGNGFTDVVTSNRASGDVSVLLNTGGVLGAPATYAVDADPRAVALGRVDGDALLDIVVSGHDGRVVQVLLNNPGSPGVFLVGPTLSVGAQLRPDGVDVEDIDGDGDQDVIAGTSGNGLNFATVFFNQGGGSFGPATNFPAGAQNPGAVLAADLDRDGRRDIAMVAQDSGVISVLRNLGGGSFAAAVTLPVGSSPQALVGEDVDLNGGLDLACVNQSSNTVSVLRNTAVLFADGFASGNTSHWSVVAP
jgi:hypothetical protein